MRSEEILLCDNDQTFTDALTGFLIDSGSKYRISVCNDPGNISYMQGQYSAVVLGQGFEECSVQKENISKVIRLTQKSNKNDGHKNEICVDRFGSMETLISAIGKISGTDRDRVGVRDARIIGVFSPMRHDLILPSALAICAMLSETGESVLFLDLEELSILPDLMGDDGDLIDYLYLQESGKGCRIQDHIRYGEGFSYMPSMKSPFEIAYITEDQWMRLIDAASGLEYESIVILFDHMLQGFERVLNNLDELVLISKPGDYYEKSERRFCDQLSHAGVDIDIHRINLSMNANNLTDGSYSITSLLHGNLGETVRKEWRSGGVRY